MGLFVQCVGLLLILLLSLYLLLVKRFSYWADRGVLHEKPILFYGNMKDAGQKYSFGKVFRYYYTKYKGQAEFCGFYLFMRRAILVLDLELAKAVMIKDFNYFAHRGNFNNERDDPLTGHLLNLDGARWKRMRANLTPTFTSGKMKFMFPTLVQVADKLISVLGEEVKNQSTLESAQLGIEMKTLLARFTTDVIGSCAFGLECNSLNDPNTKFLHMGNLAIRRRNHKRYIFAFMQAFPELARKLRMRLTQKEVEEFFMGVVRQTIEYRQRENIKRNDFLNILLELKENNDTQGLTIEQIAAQSFVFFLAGFETSSSTMSFCMYNLAMHPDIQQRAREEVNTALARHQGELTYECMRELKYLQQIVYETLRMYSIAPIVVRQTVQDYKVPNSMHVIEKGTVVVIPIDAIHHDPSIYPNPDVFDPDRFTPEAVESRHALAWLPFGDGPRNCIGMRFGEMQMMVALSMMLKNFSFSPTERTQIPLEIDETQILLTAKGGVILKVDRI